MMSNANVLHGKLLYGQLTGPPGEYEIHPDC